MYYKELIEASRRFRDHSLAYDDSYVRARSAVDWWNLADLQTQEVLQHVIGFLNKWKSRLPKTMNLAEQIKSAHADSRRYLELLQGERIEDVGFSETHPVDKMDLPNANLIVLTYARFERLPRNFGYTAASKVLHMILPGLFVMWDRAIADHYVTERTAGTYAREFLPRMQTEANDAIQTCMEEEGLDRQPALEYITARCENRPMAKLVDEYNWVVYTRGIDLG